MPVKGIDAKIIPKKKKRIYEPFKKDPVKLAPKISPQPTLRTLTKDGEYSRGHRRVFVMLWASAFGDDDDDDDEQFPQLFRRQKLIISCLPQPLYVVSPTASMVLCWKLGKLAKIHLWSDTCFPQDSAVVLDQAL